MAGDLGIPPVSCDERIVVVENSLSRDGGHWSTLSGALDGRDCTRAERHLSFPNTSRYRLPLGEDDGVFHSFYLWPRPFLASPGCPGRHPSITSRAPFLSCAQDTTIAPLPNRSAYSGPLTELLITQFQHRSCVRTSGWKQCGCAGR